MKALVINNSQCQVTTKILQKLVYLLFYYYYGSLFFQLLLSVQASLLNLQRLLSSLRSDFLILKLLPCCLHESSANAWQCSFCLEGNYDETSRWSQRHSLSDNFLKDQSCNRLYVAPYWSIYIHRNIQIHTHRVRSL